MVKSYRESDDLIKTARDNSLKTGKYFHQITKDLNEEVTVNW